MICSGSCSKVFFAFCIVTLFLLVSCAQITLEEESELGESFVDEINKSVTIISDQEINLYITELANQLLNVAPYTAHTFTFYIIDDSGFNAFAIAGDNIYLTSGTILRVRNVSELASILEH